MEQVRITLNKNDYEKLIELLNKRSKNLKKVVEESAKAYLEVLQKKQKSTKKATEKRIEQVKEKIKNAVLELKKENREINNYSVARRAEISYNTARKYSKLIKILKEQK